MSSAALENHSEKKAFLVKSSSLKEVRTFCREVFEKLKIDQSLKRTQRLIASQNLRYDEEIVKTEI